MEYEEYLCAYPIEGGCNLFVTTSVDGQMYCAKHGIGSTVGGIMDSYVSGTVNLVFIVVFATVAFKLLKILKKVLIG